MEVFYYRCSVCGYVHQVPSYWMGYAAEETHEQMHFNPETKEVCFNQELAFSGEGDEG
ncbi:MAG: hypothetical protein IKV90_09455 [Clostridia bacterium]|nr:hypothetical protein [Clostridia bacterium]